MSNSTNRIHEFDYQKDFNQLLEEARNNASKGNSNATRDDEQPEKEQFNGKEKCRKTWRNSLFTWLKTERKSKSTRRPMDHTATSKVRGEHVSGPVWGSIRTIDCGRALKAVSGPLTYIFSSTRGADEYEVPYTSLAQMNNTQNQNHRNGPIYLVT